MGDQFRATAFDEIAGFGEDVPQEFEDVAEAGFLIDRFGNGLTMSRTRLNVSGGAQRAGCGLVFDYAWGHATILRPRAPKCKGAGFSPSDGRDVFSYFESIHLFTIRAIRLTASDNAIGFRRRHSFMTMPSIVADGCGAVGSLGKAVDLCLPGPLGFRDFATDVRFDRFEDVGLDYASCAGSVDPNNSA